MATSLYGNLVGAIACVLVLVAFIALSQTVALGVTALMALCGLVAASRRLPLSLWWTLGVVIGCVIGRLS